METTGLDPNEDEIFSCYIVYIFPESTIVFMSLEPSSHSKLDTQANDVVFSDFGIDYEGPVADEEMNSSSPYHICAPRW